MEQMNREETISKSDKVCTDCNTAKTPLWRAGPAGPKSLCNACGIRFRKKCPAKTSPSPPSMTSSSSSSSTTAAIGSSNGEMREASCDAKNMKVKMNGGLRIKLMALGKEVVLLQRQRSPMKKVVRKVKRSFAYEKLGEVEEAACLLMSLSCGSVFG